MQPCVFCLNLLCSTLVSVMASVTYKRANTNTLSWYRMACSRHFLILSNKKCRQLWQLDAIMSGQVICRMLARHLRNLWHFLLLLTINKKLRSSKICPWTTCLGGGVSHPPVALALDDTLGKLPKPYN